MPEVKTHIIESSGRFGYVAYWRGHKFEIHADDGIYPAKQRVEAYIQQTLKPRGKKWVYEINIGLAERDGEQVVHVADF